MPGIKKKLVRGLAWVAGGSLLTQLINLVIKTFLARFLFPSDFGLFAMAFILIGFLNIFIGLGIGSAIIFKKDDVDKMLNAAFIISPIVGVFFFIISFLSSDFVASFFNEPILSSLIKLLSLSFIIDSFLIVPHSLLSKKMYFKRRSISDTLPVVIYGIIALSLAYSGYGVWSLIFSHIIQHIVWVSLLWAFCPWRPAFSFDWKIVKEILHFGKYVFSTSFLAFLINYIDNAIIGKKLGDEQLGYYSFAFNIVSMPVTAFTHLVSGVFHPVYSRLQDNKEKLKEVYLHSLKLIVIVIAPISGGIFVTADYFTLIVLGQKWSQMIIILQILSIYPFLRSISSLSGYFLEATGHPKKAMIISFFQLIFLVAIIIPALIFKGINGVASSIVLIWIFATFAFLYSVAKLIDVTIIRCVTIMVIPLISTLIMGIFVYLIKTHILSSEGIVNLILLVLIGVLTYLFCIFMLDKKIVNEIKDVVHQFL